MKEDLTGSARESVEACLNLFNFSRDWEGWKGSLKETVESARETDPSEEHLVDVTEDVLEFINERICPGSPEEKLMASVWAHAEPEERRALARIFLRIIED
ncbi:DUF3243 family protein [Methanomassiliicoccus luminyensis]|jgi:hypothetical protein|uniref:DUF3243 family protein n=1 Tax=Methanomassiliicoccus luminyensis TaxID=1080712 RepID=UPI00037A3ACD|nr:DUF3243 family protein [Methanomassiliicoccus luminyensis]